MNVGVTGRLLLGSIGSKAGGNMGLMLLRMRQENLPLDPFNLFASQLTGNFDGERE